jgi:hypothetical protein
LSQVQAKVWIQTSDMDSDDLSLTPRTAPDASTSRTALDASTSGAG